MVTFPVSFQVDVLLYVTLLPPDQEQDSLGKQKYSPKNAIYESSDENRLSLQLQGSAHSRLQADTKCTGYFQFNLVDRDGIGSSAKLVATIVGTARMVTASVYLRVVPCPPGYMVLADEEIGRKSLLGPSIVFHSLSFFFF